MADVKWIKITTDIFDDEKIMLIETLPDANAIIVAWFKLLCLAGKMNNSGVFMLNDKIPYTVKMLSAIFRMKESTVTLALDTFQQFDMIEIIDGVITIPKWGKHQNLDQLEKQREYQREYMQNYRKKQRLLTENSGKVHCKPNSKPNVRCLDIEEDKEYNNIYAHSDEARGGVLSSEQAQKGAQKAQSVKEGAAQPEQMQGETLKVKEMAGGTENQSTTLALFEKFWKAYPKKKDKPKAMKAWKRLKADAALLETILAAVEREKQTPAWQKESGQYIPYPATWLNGRRWEDEEAEAYIPPEWREN